MRTFSLVEGTSDKFWHIDVSDTSVTVHYGRTGTAGQRSTKEFDTTAKAAEHAAKQIASKVAKGYVEGAASAESLEPTEVKAPQPRAPKAEPAPAATPAAPEPEVEAVDFGADGLGLLMPALVRESIVGDVPGSVTPERAPRPFSPAGETSWVNAHTINEASYWRGYHRFTDLPFDEVPYEDRDRAAWWDWWLQGSEINRWGRAMPLPAKEKSAFATNQLAEHPSGSDAAFNESGPDALIAVAARLALTDPERTFAASMHAPGDLASGLAVAVRSLVMPLLSAAQRAEYEQLPVPVPQPDQRGHVPYDWYTPTKLLVLGRDEELLAELRSAVAAEEEVPLSYLYAIEDTAARVELLGGRRDFYHSGYVLDLLWLLGSDALAHIQQGLRHEYADKDTSVATITLLAAMVHGPAAVDTFIELALDSKARGVARTWLMTHPAAIKAWAAAGASPSAKAKDLISGIVRETRIDSPETFPLDSPGFIGTLVAEFVAEDSLPVLGADADLPDWWIQAEAAEAAAEVLAGKIKVPARAPSFAQPGALPPLLLTGNRLSAEQTAAVLRSAANGIGDPDLNPRPLVAAVREHMTPRVRDAIASALLDGFLTTGAKPGERAYLMAAGFLGHDGFALHLAALVREWPGQSQHQRAVLGLDVLAATGTDTALGAISGIANKSKFKGVQKAARESLEKLAALKGLSVHQLEDRVVPDGGLDERGYRTFSYGARDFRASLTPAGKLQVRDLDAEGRPTGKPRTALPAANAKDDAEAVTAAKAAYTVLRKTVTDLAKVQTARLEQAMVAGRTWTGTEHQQFLAEHPIMNSLIRPLVWSVTTADGTRTLTRVTEEQTYLLIDDEDFEMPADATVELAHRLSLNAEEADAWRQHLVDYDLTAPIEQLERAVFALPAQQTGIQLAEVPQGTINPLSLVGLLEKLGWRRGIPADAGVVNYFTLTFDSANLTVVLDISDGIWTGMIGESGDQKLEGVYVAPTDQSDNIWYVDSKDARWLAWADIDPLVVSETRRTLAALAEKMQ